MKDRDILFLGGLFPKETEAEIVKNSKGNIQNAANALQWNIVEGMDANLGNSVKIINSVYIGSFPFRYKKMNIKSYEFSHGNRIDNYNVGFLNIMGIKKFFRYKNLKPHLKNWVLDGNRDKTIIAYALTSNNLKIFKYLKKLNKEVKTCIIVPDLPEFMNTTNVKNKIYTIAKKMDIEYINKNLKYSDKFVLLTEEMSKKLNIEKKSYVVMEGIATKMKKMRKMRKSNEKIILYTGTLNERYGVINLVKAFMEIKGNNYRLIICGEGDSKEEIKKLGEKDTRIEYRGILGREQVLELQKDATVLVNPRQNNEEFCKYSFPSKILEYLSTETPVIGYKLSGIPREYDEYINYVEENSMEVLRNKLIEICEDKYDMARKKAVKARGFIESEKNAKKQTKKILEMLYK